MRVLVAGFEAFGGLAINPAALVAEAVAARPPKGLDVRAVTLPVVYAHAWPLLRRAFADVEPDVAIGLGLAGGIDGLRIERIALNLDDSSRADEAGEQRAERVILPEGPLAYAAGVPVASMARAAREAGVPSLVSLSAGSFLCNHVFFRLCHHAAVEAPGLRCGFIHLPFLPEQAAAAWPPGQPALPLARIFDGVGAALAVLPTAAPAAAA